MTINLKIPDIQEMKPRITVFGVGGAGGNAVNNMIESGLQGVDFVVRHSRSRLGTTIFCTGWVAVSDDPVSVALSRTSAMADGSGTLVGEAEASNSSDPPKLSFHTP